MKTIQRLREEGYKVRVIHQRPIVEGKDGQDVYSGKGGLTVVQIKPPGSEKNYQGSARCSDKENFCRKTGRNVALGRALKAYQEDKADGAIAIAVYTPFGS